MRATRSTWTGRPTCLRPQGQQGSSRFIYISSVAVYGRNRAKLIDETAATPKVGQAYPDSKIVAEALVRESGLPYVIIRPASTYGPRGTAWTLGPIEKIKANRLVLLGQDKGLVTPGYIDNVVDGLVLALTREKALGETFNLADDRTVTYREFYLAYARMLGRTSLPTVPGVVAFLARLGPSATLRRDARPALRRPLVAPLPVQPLAVQRGQGQAAAWLQAEGVLRRRDAAHGEVAARERPPSDGGICGRTDARQGRPQDACDNRGNQAFVFGS